MQTLGWLQNCAASRPSRKWFSWRRPRQQTRRGHTTCSISFLLYLTPDDWSDDDGGSLIIYDSTAGDEGRRVQPVAGSLVVYDSTLEHEVTATRRPRFLISGRFRELDADWSERRARSA